MIPQIGGLTDEGIRSYVDNLKAQISVDVHWDDIARSEHGKFLVVELEKDVAFWRSQYSQIDASSPTASHMLSFIQGVELMLGRITGWLREKGGQAERNQQEIEAIGELLKLRKNKQIGQTLLPTGYVKQRS